MPAKIIGNKKQFARSALKALRILVTPVAQTLGPDGLSILIDRPDTTPLSTKDGVTVANSIEVKDPIINTIIQAIKESAQKTNEYAGDGTTSALVLTEAIIRESLKFVASEQATPQKIALELEAISEKVLKSLDNIKQDVSDENNILSVARISANGDDNIAQKVFEAVDMAGIDGVITIADGWGGGITISRSNGYQIDKGWSCHRDYGPKFIQDRQKQTTEFIKPVVVLYDGALNDWNEVARLLTAIAGGDGGARQPEFPPTILVAHDFGGQIRDMASALFQKSALPVMLVQTSFMGTPQSRIYMLDDLAVLTGATVIHHGTIGDLINDTTKTLVNKDFLGCCDRIVMQKNKTIVYGGSGTPEDVEYHRSVIRKQVEDCESPVDKNMHKMRLAKITGGIVTLYVGAVSELEMREKKDRVEDSLNATRAAILEGIVPGGGVALLKASLELPNDNEIGTLIVKRALQYPIRQIVANTGESPDVVVATVLANLKQEAVSNYGYDARKRIFVDDMITSGIIDPLRVVKSAFQNAMSIAIEILKGGGYCVISNKGQDDSPKNMLDYMNPMGVGDNPLDSDNDYE